MFIIKAHVGLKNKELTQVNDCFQTKCNAENGHYGQTLNKYFRERVFTSNDGQYLAVVHTSNSLGVASYSVLGSGKFNYDQPAIEVYKNGEPFKVFTLKEVIDTNRLINNGHFFYWGYDFDVKAFRNVEFGCESCIEIYGKRAVNKGDATDVYSDKIKECRNKCDSVRLKEVELNIYKKSQYVKGNSLYILTNQNTAVRLDFSDITIKQIPFDKVVPNKDTFDAPKFKRKYKKVKFPDEHAQPNMKDGRSFEKGVADLFNLTVAESRSEKSFFIYICYLTLDKEGKCIDFRGAVYDERISESFSEESKNKDMTKRLSKWVNEQTFDTKLIPKRFDGYSFLCLVYLK